MLQNTGMYKLVTYEQISVRPWLGPENDQMQNSDPRFTDLMNGIYGPGVEAAKLLLQREIDRSIAPYSKMHTACVLRTETPSTADHYGYVEQMHTGHRTESLLTGNLTVTTASEMALSKIVRDDETISGVYLTGRDLPAGKIKRLMPIPTDYDHVVKRFSQDWGPPFFLIPPGSYDRPGLEGVTWVSPDKHVKAYAKHDRIVLSQHAETPQRLSQELKKHTHLNDKDVEFVADLTRISVENNWSAFFTGSASGLGEITPALTEEYDDMDFIIAASDPDEAEKVITEIAELHYGQLKKVPEVAYDTYGGKKIQGFFLFNTADKKLIQLAVGKSIEEVCFRPDVIARNSGIWLHESSQQLLSS